jgi:hypothetical protein
MSALEKPKSITITIADRKLNVYKSFVVYGETLEQVEKKIKEALKK